VEVEDVFHDSEEELEDEGMEEEEAARLDSTRPEPPTLLRKKERRYTRLSPMLTIYNSGIS